MELKDGKIVATEEEIKILQSETGKSFLKDKGLEVEKVVEKDIPMTDEKVQEYLKKNGSLMDKIANGIRTSFLAKKLGKEEKDITSDMLGKDLILKDDMKVFEEQAIKEAVALGLSGVKNSELLLGQVDYTKLTWNNGKLDGFTEALTELKEKYPDFFTQEQWSKTPPPLPPNNPKKITLEDFNKMSQVEKSKLTDEQLNEILRG